MSLSVKFTSKWSHDEDAGGNVRRHFPAGLVVELPDDLAAAAIFEGAADPSNGAEIPPDVQRYIDLYNQYVAQLEAGASIQQAEANMAAALAAANADGPGADAPDAPADTGAPASPGAEAAPEPQQDDADAASVPEETGTGKRTAGRGRGRS